MSDMQKMLEIVDKRREILESEIAEHQDELYILKAEKRVLDATASHYKRNPPE